ncbi:MAG: hypothetical protein B6D74_13485 [gamma proteobacterium symbiont of Ctena orbiculata]|nr:MAG: hypothetical protein B6D74_13485 [gamma proteobacterium symbiont of Ctena orbiculata]
MKRQRSSSFVLLALLFIGLSFVPVSHGADSLRVMVSIKPMHSIIAGLMAGGERPELLIDDQIPYDFAPKEDQLAAMARADLIFWVGAELEPGLAGSLEALPPGVKVVELLSHQGMKVLPSRSDPDRRDPYFWLDNRNLLIIIDDIARLLQNADPLRSHIYERNRRKLLTRLSRIDREYEYGYRGMKADLGVQYFDTLHYFEQAYALKIIDHVSAAPEREPDTLALLKVREKLANGEAGCLLYEKGFPAKHRTLLTADSNARQGELNSLGFAMPAGPDLYFEIMAHNTETIRSCLNADGQQPVSATNLDLVQDARGIGGGQFLLTDHLGGLVTKESMKGKYQIIYFGYTFCPDICPTSLQVMFRALDILGDEADRFQPYFITIDPERDTQAVMSDYVRYYDDRLIGVTGSPRMIKRVADLFRARFEKVAEAGADPSLYLMDHTASLYILDPEGRFLTKLAHGIDPEAVARELLAIINK